MAETNYEIIGRKLSVLDPEKFKQLNDPPILSDVSLVPLIFDDLTAITFKSCFAREHLCVAIILKLYEPDVLNGWKRGLTRNGLRRILSCKFICSPGNITYYTSKVRNYYLIYKSFHDEVNYISNILSAKYLNSSPAQNEISLVKEGH